MSKFEEFEEYRERMNKRILNADNKVLRRFFGVDTLAYQEGVLNVSTKEMLGLVSSLVLRCDDCVKYHLHRCYQEGLNDEEIFEVLSIGLVVGGSIVIPHLRRAVEFWDELQKEADEKV
jgi:AhpD family alkylhydroperoxidase